MRLIHAERLQVVDVLRGIASLAVCVFHLTNGNSSFLPNGILKSAGAYGWLGVEIFFVISGFILPYAMHRAGYEFKHFGTFLLKRIVRLDPPYVVTILLIIVLGYLAAMTPGYQGKPFTVSTPQILVHVAYLNAFFDYKWLNPVFWSLAIEFQYYWLVGLLFPLIANKRFSVRAGLFASLTVLAIAIPEARFVFHWLALYMMGMLGFQFQAGIVDRKGFLIWLGILSLSSLYTLGFLVTVVAAATVLVIAHANFGGKVLIFFGKISYSLYLVHIPIGMKIVNLGQRFVTGEAARWLVVVFAIAASVFAAYCLFRLVEGPAQRWSSSIKYQSVRAKLLSPVVQDA